MEVSLTHTVSDISSKLGHCRRLNVHIDNSPNADLSFRSTCTVSPNFNIADILAPDFSKHSDFGLSKRSVASPSPGPAEEDVTVCDIAETPVGNLNTANESHSTNVSNDNAITDHLTDESQGHQSAVALMTRQEVGQQEHLPTTLEHDDVCDDKIHQAASHLTSSTIQHVDINDNSSDNASTTSPPTIQAELVRCCTEDVCHSFESLLDAAQFVHAQHQLEEAEAVFSRLISKLAEPKDLANTFENLSSESGDDLGTNARSPEFSPVLGFILSQPASHLFPNLFRPSPAGRKLQDLCDQIAFKLKRAKHALRLLQRIRARKSNAKTVPSSVARALNELITTSDRETRRATFLEQLHQIWPGVSTATNLPKPQPRVYTNPTECPLSLLSFVSGVQCPRSSELSPDGTTSSSHRKTSWTTTATHSEALSVQVSLPTSLTGMNPASWPNFSENHSTQRGAISPIFSFPSSSVSPSSNSTISCGRQPAGRGRRVKRVLNLTPTNRNKQTCDSAHSPPSHSVPNTPSKEYTENLFHPTNGRTSPTPSSSTPSNWMGRIKHRQQLYSTQLPSPHTLRPERKRFPSTGLTDAGGTSNLFHDRDSNHNGTRPPTPDMRRSDLDLADLSDGTRVLLIQDTHLRAGTLYLTGAAFGHSTESTRDHLFRIQLDSEKLTTNQSPYNPIRGYLSPTQPDSPKKRRQNDVLLYGWQVLQQAVLEVFPASIRHLPPGARVCAAWSHQLAWNLYPGTVAREAEVDSPLQPGCVSVDFDDGDHRQVPIEGIRMLPDHFTNLHELSRSSGTPIVTGLQPSNHVTGDKQWLRRSGGSRVRHNSAIDNPVKGTPVMNKRKWSQAGRGAKLSPYTSGCSSAALSDSIESATLTIPSLVNEFEVQNAEPFENDNKPCSCSPQTNNDSIGELATTGNDTASIACETRTQGKDENVKESAANKPSETSPSVESTDQDSMFDTNSTNTSGSDTTSWTIGEKLRRRKHGKLQCRSIVRETDGLTVSLGDVVEFSSEGDDIYLGEIREIYWDESTDAPVVTAAWFYQPREAGHEGQRVKQLDGAVFATDHLDQNEARCITRKAVVLQTHAKYAQYISNMGGSEQRSNAAQDIPTSTDKPGVEHVYFVAGKYDPVHKRVLSWDPDVLKSINRK